MDISLLTIELVEDLARDDETIDELVDFARVEAVEYDFSATAYDLSAVELTADWLAVVEYRLLEYKSWLLNNSVAVKLDLC